MNWIKHPITLIGKHVRLEPLEPAHFDQLIIAANDRRIWEHQVIDGTQSSTLQNNLREAMLKRSYGEQYPFTIFDQNTNQIIGSTRFFDIFAQHRKLEIGWTWMHPDYWGSGYNAAIKLLMLAFCFEELRAIRVQIKTRATNERSKAAIRKIGAVEEGVLRNDRILPNGQIRDTVMFSIIDREWPAVKELLQTQESAISGSR